MVKDGFKFLDFSYNMGLVKITGSLGRTRLSHGNDLILVNPRAADDEWVIMDNATIEVRGAREHNLRNVSINLPRNQLIVFTGVSGSGKSSMAFDTLYAGEPIQLRAAVYRATAQAECRLHRRT
jgi:ABC-type multidrug transport system fused ATPase/permease subunit